MKRLKLGKHELSVYDDVETMPVARFHRYNKMLLLDSGIGSDLNDFAAHVEKAKRYLIDGDKNAIAELDNLLRCVMFIQSELSPRHMAFAALVAEIDGERCDDLSDEGLRRTAQKLGDVPQNELASLSGEAKKKIDDALAALFPDFSGQPQAKQYKAQIKRRALLLLDEIIDGKKRSAELAETERKMLAIFPPLKFDGRENAEAQFERGFENICLYIAQELHADAKKMTVAAFYSANEYLKKLYKEREKTIKNAKRK